MIFNNEISDLIWPKGRFTDDAETILRFICRFCQAVNLLDLNATEELTRRQQWHAHCCDCSRKMHVVN